MGCESCGVSIAPGASNKIGVLSFDYPVGTFYRYGGLCGGVDV